jgi:ABC-2 type transport system ATP-binding protein
MDAGAAMQRAHELLDLVELENERYRPVETYSGGMKQRTKLAQALVHDPQLLLLDEPTNGMDPRGRRLILDLIRDLGRRGVSVLLSSHLLPDVQLVCERVVVLGRGRVLAQGAIDDMRQPSRRRCTVGVRGDADGFRARLGTAGVQVSRAEKDDRFELELPGDDEHQLILEAVRDSDVQLRELRPYRSSLEQVFLEAVRSQQPDIVRSRREGDNAGSP